MAPDVNKHLERARRFLERNKLGDAIEDYQAVLEAAPNHQEALQMLGDLFTRQGEPGKAANYYGMLFDRLVETDETAKAAALYSRLLKAVSQPPERMARYAMLLQRQHKLDESIEHYQHAAELYLNQRNPIEALACCERIAQVDPDNPARHIRLGEIAEQAGKTEAAARGYLRAGQLTLAHGELDPALELFGHAHKLLPSDRSVALVFASARLGKGDAAGAVQLLEPFPPNPADLPFLETFGEALLRIGQLDRARQALEAFYRDKEDGFELLFELADQYFKAGQHAKGVEIVSKLKDGMFKANRQNALAAAVDKLAEANPKSLPLTELWCQLYNELNRETQYFEVLLRLFDLNLEAGNMNGACDALDRLVEIDPYDSRNHERADLLEGKADPSFLKGIRGRLAKTTSLGGQPHVAGRPEPASLAPVTEEARARQALEDLIVQAEIFLQYSLRDKVTERLEKIAEMFPGEEEHNERLRVLQETVGWRTGGVQRPAESVAAPAPAASAKSGVYSAETLRDLAKISEITGNIYRQSTPKEVLAAAVQEIGKYLDLARCLAAVGAPGGRPQMAAEYCASGVEAASGAAVGKLLARLAEATPEARGAIELNPAAAPLLRELGLESLLAVPLADRDTQTQAGILVAASAAPRAWKPNESYFLQAVGDQMLLCVNHTKLRSLVRTLAVADEKTGLLGRSAYLDCLLAETGRAHTQSTTLSLLILQVDSGPELMRQKGEALFDRYMEQLVRALAAVVRQNDLAVKYSAWALALILPDTGLEGARALAEKLRQVAAGVRPPWNKTPLALSAAAVEAVGRPDYESEDIVTDLINRAEFCLEEARKKGGGLLVSPETPRV
jgi:diguanylate cyclase (GGDEF)-like protein